MLILHSHGGLVQLNGDANHVFGAEAHRGNSRDLRSRRRCNYRISTIIRNLTQSASIAASREHQDVARNCSTAVSCAALNTGIQPETVASQRMSVDDSRIDIKAKGAPSIARRRINHVIRERLGTIPGKHHGRLALIIRRRVNMPVEILARVPGCIGVVLEITFNSAGSISVGVVSLSEGLVYLLLSWHNALPSRLVSIMITHKPTAQVGSINRDLSVGNAEVRGIHTLVDELLRELLFEVEERSRIIGRNIHCDVHLWRGVGADIDGVGLASAKRQRGEPPPPRTRSTLRKQARTPLPFLFAMCIFYHQSLRLLIHD